jgi:hypothetical protein
MTASQIKALTDLELLTKYELYKELQSTGFKDQMVMEMMAIEIDLRDLGDL